MSTKQPFRACEGEIAFGATPDVVGFVTRFTYDERATEVTYTVFGNCNEQSKNGNLQGEGSIDVMWDSVDDVGQAALVAALKAGTTGAIRIRPVGAGTDEPELTGTVSIPGRQISADAAELYRGVFNFKGVLSEANQT